MVDQAEYLRRVEEIADVVRSEAGEADHNRRLGDKTVQALRDAGLFRMLLDERYGGGGLTLGETYPVVEAMSRIDGSTGWNLNIGSTGLSLVATMADEARDELLEDPDTLVAGTINFMAIKATRVDGGYVFNGRATFMSGSSYATWIFIGGWLHEQGKPLFAGSMPLIVRGVVPAATLNIDNTWQVSGMRATASNDATLDDVFVPDRYIGEERSGLQAHDPSARLPLLTRLGGLAHVGVGTARGALDALAAIAGDKVALGTSAPLRERPDVQIDVARATGLVESGAAYLERTWAAAEAKCRAGDEISVDDQAALRLAYVTAADQAASAADLVVRAAGSSSLFESERIERFWRDTHAVTKHVTVSVRGYERVGRVLLGLDPLPGLL